MGMKALSVRVEAAWMALAITSLPVPLSPEISTVERDGATCVTRSSTVSIFSLLPTMFGKIVALLERALEVDVFLAQAAPFDGQRKSARSIRRWTTAW